MWRLQRGVDLDCVYFQLIANQGHYGKGGGTRQGIYVCTARGELLASINSLDPEKVLKTLDEGLAAWRLLAPEKRTLNNSELVTPRHRWESSYPAAGLVLKSFIRSIPDDGELRRNDSDRWNMDHAWFDAEEAKQWLPKRKVPGERARLDTTITERMVRFHLLDNVRGQALPFAAEEIKGALESEILTASDAEVTVRISGKTRAIADGVWRMGDNDWKPRGEWPRSIETELLGFARYDPKQERFVQFELVATSSWQGPNWLNGRGKEREGRIAHLFRLGSESPSDRVAPAYIDLYNASWVVKPN